MSLDHIAAPLHPLAVEIDSVHRMEDNPNVGDVDAVKASVSTFGQLKPIVVDAATMEVVAGNTTHEAMEALGATHIAAVVSEDPSDVLKAFALADNRTRDLARWNDALVGAMLADVPEDIVGQLGWDPDDISDLIAEHEDSLIPDAPDALPDAPTGPNPHARQTDPESATDAEGDIVNDDFVPKPTERRETYEQSAIRSVIVPLQIDSYTWAIKVLGDIRKAQGLGSNTDAIVWLLESWSGESAPEAAEDSE